MGCLFDKIHDDIMDYFHRHQQRIVAITKIIGLNDLDVENHVEVEFESEPQSRPQVDFVVTENYQVNVEV